MEPVRQPSYNSSSLICVLGRNENEKSFGDFDSYLNRATKNAIKLLITFLFLLVCYIKVEAQSSLSTGSNLTISSNTTYSSGNIYSSAVITIASGTTVTFTGGVSFSSTSKFVIQSGATVIIQSGGLSFSSSATSSNAGSLVVTGGLTVGGGTTFNSSGSIVVISSGLTLNNSSTLSATGPLEVRGGGLSLNSGSLTFGGTNNKDTIVGAVAINNSSSLTLNATNSLYVSGNITNNQGSMVLNDALTVNGSYQSWNTSSITGTGDITTTGSLNAGGSSTVFGLNPVSCSGPNCDGLNLCGRTASISPASPSVCTGSSTTLTASLTGTGTKTYQWMSSSTSGGTYTNISGATTSTYTASPVSTTFYKVKITVSGCTTISNFNSVTILPAPTISSTTPASICGSGSVSLGASASAGTVNWYTASTGGTSIATGTIYSPTISATTTYYVDATSSGCTTASRTAVVATVNPIPTVFVNNTAATICSGSSVVLTAAGDPGKALSLSGTNQYIQLNNDPLSSASDFTFEALIYWTDNTTQWQRIFDFGNNTNVNMFFTTKSSSGFPRYAITKTGNGGEQQINTTTSITTNTWHHVAVTYNASTTTGIMYIDGVAVGTNTSMTLSPASLLPKPLAFNYLGESQYVADPNFAGSMDEIRIWDITRTSAEINANKSISIDPATPDLVAYYKLNEGSGASVTSASGTGTATVAGSPSWVTSTAPVIAPGGLTTTYAWSPSTGLNTTSGATVTASPISNQVYTVTATYSNGCTSTATSTITVSPLPTAVAGTTITTCSTSGAVNITAGASATNQSGVAWTSSGTGTFSNAASLTLATYNPSTADKTAGSVTIKLTATGSGSCSSATAVSTKTFTILGVPTATAGGNQTVCVSSTATVSGASSTNGTISWTENGAGSITSGATTLTPVYTPAAGDAGTTVTLTMTVSNAACTNATATYSVIVNACISTWTGATSTAWNLAGNWSPASIPTSQNNVVIPATVVSNRWPVIANGITATAAKVTLNSGGTASLIINSGGTLNTYGSITNSGTFTANSGSTIALLGTTAQTLTGISTLYNTTVNNASGVTIASGAANAITLKGKLSLTNGTLTTNNNLKVDIDNGGNIGYASGDAGTVSGNVTVFRAINSITTHYISCPLDGVTANDLADDAEVINPATNKTRLFQFDNIAYKWTAVSDLSTTMAPGNSFSMWFPAATSVDFTGTYTHSANYSYSAPNVASKFMFVSNPYPSTLDWDAASGWTKSGINNAVYFWNPLTNSYTSYVNGAGTNSATKYIPAMNSFFVAYTGSGPSTATVSMNGLVRSATTASMWRTASDETVRLTLKSTTAADETVIRFNEDATNDFDGDLDAFKMMNPSSVPSIYTLFGSTKYSINSISSPYAKDTIQVYTKVPSDGDYVLSIVSSNPSIEYVLVDKKLGTESVVTSGDYTFTASTTDNQNRFDLQMRQTTTTGVTNGIGTSGIIVLSSPNGFLVKSNATGTGTIEILDVTGNVVKVLPNVSLSSGNNFFTPEIAEGLYLVKVNIYNASYVGHVSIIK